MAVSDRCCRFLRAGVLGTHTPWRKLEIYSWPSPLAGPTKQIAALGDLEGSMPGASVRWERRHPAGLGQARRVPEATALCRDRLSGPLCGPDAGETPAVPGEAALPGGFALPRATR